MDTDLNEKIGQKSKDTVSTKLAKNRTINTERFWNRIRIVGGREKKEMRV